MVVDGQAAFVGSDVGAARLSIERAVGRPHGVLTLTLTPLERSHAAVAVAIGELPGRSPDDRAELLVAVVEDRLRTEVKRGENGGRTLVHAAVARDLPTAGDVAAGATARTDLRIGADWRRDALTVVAFVQERRSRRVLATAAERLR